MISLPTQASRALGWFRRPLWGLLTAALATLGLAACGWWSLETRTPPLPSRRTAPSFSLPDHRGKLWTLDSLLAKGPALVIFYRGHW